MRHDTDQSLLTPTVLLRWTDDAGVGSWRRFSAPKAVIRAHHVGEVAAALHEVERAVDNGWHAAGFLSYEAAPAFDPALATHPAGALPLLWFGLFHEPETLDALPASAGGFTVSPWTPSVDVAAYHAAIARIRAYIAAGDTYQVNYTLRLRAALAGDPYALFTALARAQRTAYSAYVDIGDHVLCSASPELFFRLFGTTITTRPMKGTARRGLTLAADDAQGRWLRESAKNRAENVMIVDMLRNDLGRVARTGSVRVERLFDVERYDSVLQMTSTVTAESDAPLGELFRALFPCASITGAPKVRTMQIIRELEPTPRGVYTGCIGAISPGRRASFNVAIRTVHLDRATGTAEYGSGGGIVWDSQAEDEYAEMRTKTLVLFNGRPDFRLLETLLWKPVGGYFLLARHLARLRDSARYFGFRLDISAILARLQSAVTDAAARRRVRLLVAEDGEITVESYPLTRDVPRRPWTLALAPTPVDPADRFLYHKTTHRAVYDAARAAHPDCDDVLLYNTRGELTESCLANVVLRKDGRLLTPAAAAGLLPGTLRAHLLAAGHLHEAVLTLDDLHAADAVYLINSVRGFMRADTRI